MNKSQRILMLACLVIGIGAVAAFWLFDVPGKSILFVLLLLFCPLSHFLMMQFMGHGDTEHDHAHNQVTDVPSQVELNVGKK